MADARTEDIIARELIDIQNSGDKKYLSRRAIAKRILAALQDAGKVIVNREPDDKMADALCAARNEEPLGTWNRFVDGAWHSCTFRDQAKHDLRAMLLQAEKEG